MIRFSDENVTLYHGDSLEVLAEMPEASVDAVVTDPPYELGFMGKAWDASGIAYSVDLWREVLRVVKPGGHLLAFGGTRTWHRMVCAIEDAGFEIRDELAWLYGQGFPKSLDVSKAIDRARGEDLVPAATVARWLVDQMEARGIGRREVSEHFGAANIAQQWTTHWVDGAVKPRVPTWDQWVELRSWLDLPDDMDAEVWRLNGRKGQPGEAWFRREVLGTKKAGIATPGDVDRQTIGGSRAVEVDITAPATPDAERWQGWGTALKPAHEPICLARKPLVGTVAENVLTHGTGALNVDGCRVGTTVETWPTSRGPNTGTSMAGGVMARTETGEAPAGRWPANVVLDEEAAALLDQQSGHLHGAGGRTHRADRSPFTSGSAPPVRDESFVADSGGASRFFYVAKAAKHERPRVDGKAHATVKPVELMRWLVRLVTPPGGLVLDPFAGSGTTAEACIVEGIRCVLIEKDADHLPLIEARLSRPIAPTLFGGAS